MTLAVGTSLGPYQILAPLGAGGMGEVYRARDTRLGRDVAIKVILAESARDPERIKRFEQEARAAGALTHPNVCAIHDLGAHEGSPFVVMELLEGESLRAKLDAGPIPVRKAVDWCVQVAHGLAAAHEKGIVHRDLKPENLFLTKDGRVKVLDFGLAKLTRPEVLAPTGEKPISIAATETGAILGTVGYMSPEQVLGKPADARSDLFALGAILYELLTGKRVFHAASYVETLHAILNEEPPPLSASGREIPAGLEPIVRRCLEKEPGQRFQTASDLAFALGAAGGSASGTMPAIEGRPTTGRRYAALLLAVAVAGIALGVFLSRLRPAPPDPVTRLSVVTADPDAYVGGAGTYAVSPDGRSLAYLGADSLGSLSIRRLDKDASDVLEGTEGAAWPFWSPDSREVAFFSGGRLRRIPASGGAVRTLCDASNGRGGSWGRTGVIVFAPDSRGGLAAVDAGGGTPRPVTVVDSAIGEISHRFPSFLPDGRHFVFADQVRGDDDERPESPVMVGSADGARAKPLLKSGSAAVFAAPHWLVFTRGKALLAQRIDLAALKLVGEPTALGDQPDWNTSIDLSPVVSCSQSGVMAYSPPDLRPTAVAWIEPDGRRTETRMRLPASVGTAAISPDHRRLAVTVGEAEGNAVWIADLQQGTAEQIAPSGKGIMQVLWNPAGTRLLGPTSSRLRQIDAGTGADSLFDLGDDQWRRPNSWSPDGQTLVLSALVKGNRFDLQTLSLQPGHKPRPYLATTADETSGMLSHDGRLIAYLSDASGRTEVYVERFPEHSEVVRIGGATSGLGGDPVWSADDHQLFCFGGGAEGAHVYAIEVRTSPRLSVGVPRAVQRLPVTEARGAIIVDDGRLLLLLPQGKRSRSITLVHGWLEELNAQK